MPLREKSKLLIIGIIILLLALGTGTFLASKLHSEETIFRNPCSVRGTDPRLIKLVEDQFKEMKISGSFLIGRNEEILAQGFCGTSNPAEKSPIKENTKFNIGSLTKQFTGYLLLELVREGKVALDQPLSKYIPELSDRPIGRATLEQTMRMRSGVPYILPTSEFIGLQFSKRIRTEQEMIQAIGKLDLDFQPGEKFSYSNLGYSLLGIVIGRADQSTWARSLQTRIFGPFGMIHSEVEGEKPAPPDGLATGLIPFAILSKTFFLSLPHWNYSMIKGAGAIVSTADDLHRWNVALSARAAKDPKWATSYFPEDEPREENYSYGWFLSESEIGSEKVRTINHGGEDPGYCATNIRIPSLKAHIVLTTNSDYCALREGAYRPFTKTILKALSAP